MTSFLGKKAGKCPVNESENILKYFYWVPYHSYLLIGFITVEIKNHKVLTTYTQTSKLLEVYVEDFVISYLGPYMENEFPDFHHLYS